MVQKFFNYTKYHKDFFQKIILLVFHIRKFSDKLARRIQSEIVSKLTHFRNNRSGAIVWIGYGK